MKKINFPNKICVRCDKIFGPTGNHQKYCKNCRKDRERELDRIKKRRYALTRPKRIRNRTNHRNKFRKVICAKCGELKLHEALSLCLSCYQAWSSLDKKLESMDEFEKKDYLSSHGLLDNKKKLTIDDLKKDLGVSL